MTAYTAAAAKAAQDFTFPTSASADHIAYSANGSSETANLGRTAVGATGWSAATSASPSVKANANTITSPAASGAVTVTHFAVFDAASSGTQKTVWVALDTPRTLALGDRLEHQAGDIEISLD